MIDKLNISIKNKDTKKIKYKLNLDNDWWRKYEYDTRGNLIYCENGAGYWYKMEYNNKNKVIYYENNIGIITDKR
jgi:hypothetical protein